MARVFIPTPLLMRDAGHQLSGPHRGFPFSFPILQSRRYSTTNQRELSSVRGHNPAGDCGWTNGQSEQWKRWKRWKKYKSFHVVENFTFSSGLSDSLSNRIESPCSCFLLVVADVCALSLVGCWTTGGQQSSAARVES